MSEEDYIKKIIQIASDNLPVKTGWTKFRIEISFIHNFAEFFARYYTEDGNEVYFNPRYGNENNTNNLAYICFAFKQEMYRQNPRNESWWQCIIEVANTGKYNVQYNYDVPEYIMEWRRHDIK